MNILIANNTKQINWKIPSDFPYVQTEGLDNACLYDKYTAKQKREGLYLDCSCSRCSADRYTDV